MANPSWKKNKDKGGLGQGRDEKRTPEAASGASEGCPCEYRMKDETEHAQLTT